MSYNNNYNGGGYNNQNRGRNNNYNGGGYNNQRSNSNGYSPEQIPFKKSGAKYSKITREGSKHKGLYVVNAWNVSRKGMITCFATPIKSKKHGKALFTAGKAGKTWCQMLATVTHKRTGQIQKFPCVMDMETQVLTISELNMTITPNGQGRTRSGKSVKGYFGTYLKK